MERNIQITEEQRALIERFGVYMERTGNGMTPVETRIIGLLGVSDIIELTFDEIQEILSISKGATSNALNRLLEIERIEYITKPGDRKRYFRLAMNGMEVKWKEKLQSISTISVLWEEILAQRNPETEEFNAEMRRAIDFLHFVEEELPQLFRKWLNRKK